MFIWIEIGSLAIRHTAHVTNCTRLLCKICWWCDLYMKYNWNFSYLSSQVKPLFEIEFQLPFVAFNNWSVLILILLFVLICLLMTFENLGCHTTEGMQPPRPDGSHQRTPPSSSSCEVNNSTAFVSNSRFKNKWSGLQSRFAYPPLRRTLKVSLNGVVGSCVGPRAGESQCSPCACDTPAYK